MTAEIKSLSSSPTGARFETLRLILVRYADVWWMVALALFTAAYCLQYDILRQPIPHDTTFHIYAAQQMLEGHAIYRDVAIIKAPLSDFAAAFAIMVGRLLPISDIMSTRLLSLLSVMAAASVTYLAGRVLFNSRAAGLIAGLVMATWNFYGLRSLTGPEPKEFLIVFALLAMIFIAQRRWLLAGACASLSTLAWQPALMVQAIALAGAFCEPWLASNTPAVWGAAASPKGSAGEKQGRAGRGLRQAGWVMLGFAIPLGLVILYLGLNNALVPAFNATIGANVVHFNNTQAQVPLLQLIDANLAEILVDGSQYCFSYNEYWLIGAGALGFLGLVGSQIVGGIRSRRLPFNLNVTPLILFGLGFAAFSLIDFDYCPDLLPLIPVLALGAGWLAATVARGIGRLVMEVPSLRASDPNGKRAETIVIAVIGVVLIAIYWFDAWDYEITGTSFLDQLEVAHVASEYLQPGDKIQTFGNTIVPIQLHMQNESKILHLGSKSGLGVLSFEEGGVEGMLAELDRDPPRVITLARENRPDWTDELYEWMERRYEPGPVFGNANMRILIFKE